MIDLSKEAEEYAAIPSTLSLTTRQKIQIAYVAGANSKYVQAKAIQAQIDILKEIRSKMTMFEISNMENTLDNLYYKEQELQQQLKQLENE